MSSVWIWSLTILADLRRELPENFARAFGACLIRVGRPYRDISTKINPGFDSTNGEEIKLNHEGNCCTAIR